MKGNAGKFTMVMIAAVAAIAFALPTVISFDTRQYMFSIIAILLMAVIAILIMALRKI